MSTFADKYRKTGSTNSMSKTISGSFGSSYRKDSPTYTPRPSTPVEENKPGLMGTTQLIQAPKKDTSLYQVI